MMCQFDLGRILLVPSVFSRQQLNSETSRLRRRSFPFQKEWAYRFRKVSWAPTKKRGSQAKLSQRKHIGTRILSKSAKPSSSRSRGFGRPSKPTVFGRQYQKNSILKPTKIRRQPAEKRRYQKNTPLVCYVNTKQTEQGINFQLVCNK